MKAKQYRCFAHLNLGNSDRAIADCSTALPQNPRLTQAYLWRSLSYYRSGNYSEAIKNYNQVLAQTPEHPQALYNREAVTRYSISRAGTKSCSPSAQISTAPIHRRNSDSATSGFSSGGGKTDYPRLGKTGVIYTLTS
ncbi:MAG: tetratricopeptide repeat protein [Cyanobacteria bacterium]|nr:tetratricopeptide repeat protein [Cyanobacteria bacterium GSL.Bin1]